MSFKNIDLLSVSLSSSSGHGKRTHGDCGGVNMVARTAEIPRSDCGECGYKLTHQTRDYQKCKDCFAKDLQQVYLIKFQIQRMCREGSDILKPILKNIKSENQNTKTKNTKPNKKETTEEVAN